MLEGSLRAATTTRDMAINELKGVQTQLTETTAQISFVRTEVENWRRQAEESQRLLSELRESTKPARSPRKPKAD